MTDFLMKKQYLEIFFSDIFGNSFTTRYSLIPVSINTGGVYTDQRMPGITFHVYTIRLEIRETLSLAKPVTPRPIRTKIAAAR